MKKILIVDDDQFFAKTVASALPLGKYKILKAEDGEEGFRKVEQDKPDLVILDMMMPKLDGMGFLKKMKEVNLLNLIPVLVSSNLSSMKKVSDCLSLGAAGYILKSDESLDSIVQDIERILNSKT